MQDAETRRELPPEQRGELLGILKARFEKNTGRHKGLEWARILAKLDANPEKLWSLNEMERTGGEPDVVGYDNASGEFIFYDCSAETPTAAETFVTTVKPSSRGKSINQGAARLIWPLPWASSL